jgi:hypothetical protein
MFSAPGIYLLRLTADDSSIERADLAEVRVEALCTIEDPDGLRAWWPGNGTAREALHGEEGFLVNGAGFANGKVADAFHFDGTNDYAVFEPVAHYDIGTSDAGMSIELWVRAPSIAGNRAVLSWNKGTTNGVHLVQASAALSVRLQDTLGAAHTLPNINNVFNNTWRHVGITYHPNTGQARVYVDGILASTRPCYRGARPCGNRRRRTRHREPPCSSMPTRTRGRCR